MKLRLTKHFEFQMAHALTGYDGKCQNIHGHNYKLLVTVEGTPIADSHSAKQGMVMDFGTLKELVEEVIINKVDHALVVNEHSTFATLKDTKLLTVPFQPTSENLLLWFAELLGDHLQGDVHLHALRLYETDSSCAELICD